MEREFEAEKRPAVGFSPPSADLADFTGSLLSTLYDDTPLNECYDLLTRGEVNQAMSRLAVRLNELFMDSSDPEWKGFVQFCMLHPLRKLLHQDPFTRHAYEKPRGYPGDPILLDYLCPVESGRRLPEDTSELGRRIFEYTTRTQVCDGVRTQTQTIARTVDQLAASSNKPHVLSVMAGHLREASFSEELKRDRLGRWVALDFDADSLKEIRRSYGDLGIETVAGTGRQIVTGQLSLGEFDLVYSMGLYNNLEQDVGQHVTERLFHLLRPGGQLVISGFLVGIPERGFMESFMDWRLNYRSSEQMLDLAARLDPDQVADLRFSAVGHHAHPHLGMLQIKKA